MTLLATRNTLCECGHVWAEHFHGWYDGEKEGLCRQEGCSCPRPRKPRRRLLARALRWLP